MSRWIADLVLRHARWIIVSGALAAVAGAVGGWYGVRLDADLDKLISADRPFKRAYDAFKDRFGDLERIWVVVDAHGDDEAGRRIVDWLEPRLRAIDLPQVSARITRDEQAKLVSWSAPPKQVEAIAQACGLLSLSAQGAPELLSASAQELDKAVSLGGGNRIERESRVRAAVTALTMLVDDDLLPSDQLMRSPTGRLHFLGLMPHKDYGTLSVIEGPLARVRSVLDSARAEFPAVDIGLTGKPVLQADEMRTTQADMRIAAMVAMSLVTALVIIILRDVKRPLLALLAFSMAVGWTWGFVAIALGRLTLLSIVFLLVMIGVGLDFGVHIVSRHARMRSENSLEATIHLLLSTTARANLVAAMTSVAVFLMSLVTEFKGLQELGIIAAVGISLSVVAMSTVLPALLVVFDRHVRSRPKTPRVPGGSRGRRLVLAVALITGAAGWVAAADLRFDTNLLALQAPDLEAARWERRIAADSGAPTWFAAMQAADLEEASGFVEAARREQAIGKVDGILSVVATPDPARRAARRALASCTPAPTVPMDGSPQQRAVSALRTVVSLAGEAGEADAEQLRTLADRIEAMSTAELQSAGRRLDGFFSAVREGASSTLRNVLPEAVRRETMAPDGTLLVVVHPSVDVWDEAAMAGFVDAARRVDPNVTGVPVTHLESLRDMKQGFIEMTLWAVLAVAAIMFLESRRLWEPLVCLGTLAMAGGWTLGVAALVDLHLNLANFFAVPVLLGLGVDGAIHMAHRLRRGRGDGATRRAVLLTSLTTMVGFGSLMLASHRGQASLGGLMAIGCLACLIAALYVIPAALQLGSRGKVDT